MHARSQYVYYVCSRFKVIKLRLLSCCGATSTSGSCGGRCRRRSCRGPYGMPPRMHCYQPATSRRTHPVQAGTAETRPAETRIAVTTARNLMVV